MFPSGWHWLWVTTAALLATAFVWYTRHPTARAVLRGGFGIPDGEVEALRMILRAAGVRPRQVRVVQTRPGEPCWSYTYRHWIDARLRVFRQFGRYGHNVVGVAGGHVVGLSLVGTDLADMAPLARLRALDHVQLRESRIARVAGLADPCRWTHLVLQRNALIDAEALVGATRLEALDLSFNRLEQLPPLGRAPRLRELDLRLNRLDSVRWMRGHPGLERVELYGNPLRGLVGADGLPRLEGLDVSDTGLATLRGLRDLPALRRLRAASNHITELDPEVLDTCPALASLDLSSNPLRRLPGFAAVDGNAARMRPEGGGWPEVNVSRTPLGEAGN